jgi:hypothetical protein
MSTAQQSPDKYTQVREDIAKAFPNEEYDDGSFAPVVYVIDNRMTFTFY